jgi:acetyl esterase
MTAPEAERELDADARAVLDMVAASGRPPLHLLSVDAARAAVRSSQQILGKTPPPARIREIGIPGAGGTIALRIYRPSMVAEDAVLPVLLFLHGGGWMLGDLEYGAWFCASLAEGLRIAVVAVDYRLAPEHPFPAGLDDCLTALEHVRRYAGMLAMDRDRIAIAGDSAGANLAAACALLARDEDLSLRAQILLYPVTDLAEESDSYRRNAEGFGLTADAMRWFREAYLGRADPRDRRLSPLRAETLEGLAPALVLTCGFDPLCDEGDLYAARLGEAGVVVRHIEYTGQIHGFLMWPKMVAAAERALAQIADELRARLLV